MNRLTIIAALSLANCAMGGTLLNFNVNPVSAGILLDQAYGDRVIAASDSVGAYGTDNGTYTPNVLTSYSGTPRVWTTGYGNFTNVFYNDDEGGDIQLTLTADPGFLVTLASFDLAGFGANYTLNGLAISVRDGGGNTLFSVNGPFVVNGTTSTSVTPNVSAQVLQLDVFVSQLAGSSDNVALDNLLFSQQVAPDTSGVPEPGTFALVSGALTAAFAARRRRK